MKGKAAATGPKKIMWAGVVFGSIFLAAGVIAFFTVIFHELSRYSPDWLSVMSSSLFLLFFVAPGGALVHWSLNRKTVIGLIDMARSGGIPSEEKQLFKIFFVVAAVLAAAAVPILIGGLIEEEAGTLGMLVFLLIAAGLYLAGKKQKQNYEAIGSTPLQMHPVPGCIGGQLGGAFTLSSQVFIKKLDLRVNCIHTYSSGSGSSSSTQSNVLFQKEMRPYIDKNSGGDSDVRFVFDIPGDLPETDAQGYRGTIHWEVQAIGTIKLRRMVGGRPADFWLELQRHWKVPVMHGDDASLVDVPQVHLQDIDKEEVIESKASLAKQIDVTSESEGLHIISEAGRHKTMWQSLGFVGLGVAGIALFLWFLYLQGSGVPPIIVLVFSLVGILLPGGALYLAGRKLEARIKNGRTAVVRSLFGRTLYQRQGVLSSINQLSIERTMSSQSQDRTLTEYFAVYMQYGDKKIKLVEAIEGKRAAELMLQRIGRQTSSTVS